MNYFELYPGDYLWDTGRPLIAYRAWRVPETAAGLLRYSAAFACRLERSIYHCLRYYSG
ncbi:hypothetical protein XF_0336 [Xylella fastidiosa 9a5c]|uniref:Uncharacterized protein n=1 Tax=Xylella fastidiosa (strain 9a5c) TaxID=160492 RepID=Q9PGG6_XYLFA|nr:hypothetical protein XF_0336 [Xylella fastidiosa 9a5c]